MKLSHPLLENPIIFEENKINVLVIENQKCLAQLLEELVQQINGYEGGFVLSSNSKQIEINKKVGLLIDPFNIDFNQKKIITKLYNQLKSYSYDGDYYLDFKILMGETMKFVEKISQATQYPITYSDEVDIVSLFKMIDIKLEQSFDNLIEKVMDYCSIIQEFCDFSCIILLNIKCYLSELELEQFYKYIEYKKLNILLLENTVREKKFENELLHIIDADLCKII